MKKSKRSTTPVTAEQRDLIVKNRSLIYSFVHKRFSRLNRESKKDMISEAMLAAFETVGAYDPAQGAYSTYLYSVLHYRCMNLYYSQSRKWGTPMEYSEDIIDKNYSYQDEDAYEFDEKEKAIKGLEILTDDEKSVITMFFIEKYSAEEIADKLSLKKVKLVYRLRRKALRKLKQYMTT